VPVPKGTIVVRFVKEMPQEATFIDQVRLRVEETDQRSGEKRIFYLEGEFALKNSSGSNMRTAFLNDGNHISIQSSRKLDSLSKWGVKTGDILEVTFKVPRLTDGHARDYYVI